MERQKYLFCWVEYIDIVDARFCFVFRYSMSHCFNVHAAVFAVKLQAAGIWYTSRLILKPRTSVLENSQWLTAVSKITGALSCTHQVQQPGSLVQRCSGREPISQSSGYCWPSEIHLSSEVSSFRIHVGSKMSLKLVRTDYYAEWAYCETTGVYICLS